MISIYELINFRKNLRLDLVNIRILKLIFIIVNPSFIKLGLKGVFPNIEHLSAIREIGSTKSDFTHWKIGQSG